MFLPADRRERQPERGSRDLHAHPELSWAEERTTDTVAKTDVLFHAGCLYSFNPTLRSVVQASARVLASWGYNVVHHYENDESGRLRQLLDMRAGTTTNVVRDTALNRTAYVLPSGDSIIHGATETRYTDLSASGALSRYYRYDEAQRLLQRGPTALTNSGYSYDTRWQLAGELTNQDGNVVAQRQFTWDGAGNPTHAGASVTSGNRLEGFDGYTLTYDDDGNLLRKYKPAAGIDWSYEWNSLGQLVAAGLTPQRPHQLIFSSTPRRSASSLVSRR